MWHRHCCLFTVANDNIFCGKNELSRRTNLVAVNPTGFFDAVD